MKKALKYILVVLVIVSMMSTMAMAASPAKQYGAVINGEQTITREEYYKLNAMIDSANAKIVVLVTIAQITPWNDIKWLKSSVDDVIADVQEYAANIGTKVGCAYTEYYVDGKWVKIDPIIYIPIKIWP